MKYINAGNMTPFDLGAFLQALLAKTYEGKEIDNFRIMIQHGNNQVGLNQNLIVVEKIIFPEILTQECSDDICPLPTNEECPSGEEETGC